MRTQNGLDRRKDEGTSLHHTQKQEHGPLFQLSYKHSRDAYMWHRILGHPTAQVLENMSSIIPGLHISANENGNLVPTAIHVQRPTSPRLHHAQSVLTPSDTEREK